MPPLYVVTALFNQWRYRSRPTLYRQFRKYIADQPNCRLFAGELAFGDRPYEMTTGHRHWVDDGETFEVQFRTRAELWHKERMLNRLIMELPSDWEYVAWIDADLQFARPDWAEEAVHLLQHYDVVQMFSHAQNLAPNHEVLKCKAPRPGFVYAWEQGIQPAAEAGSYYPFQFGHPGFAWAWRRDAFERCGGFFDVSILGSGDYHMALALIHQLELRVPGGISNGYREQLQLWADRARRHINRNIGYVPGLVNHYWHGNRRDRRYGDRWQILVNHQYDPEFDLKPDAQGLWQWTDRCPDLHYDIRRYFAARDEDSTYTD